MGLQAVVACLCFAFSIETILSQQFNNHRGPWTVVFKIPRGARPPGFSSVNAFWTASGHYNGEDVTAMRDFTASSKLYKSKWLDDWNKRSFSAVRLSAYKDNKEVAYVVFDSMGKSKNDWLDCGRIIESSYTDITTATKNYCEMNPNTGRRTFFINHQYGGCTSDAGWFMLKDYDATGECIEWDVMAGTPYFYYSASTTLVNWSSGSRGTADVMVVSVMAWDMVFKAVEGVVPPQGGLRQLWYSSDTLNSDNPTAQTLTKDPYLVYKSKNVETWRSIPGFFIESVKYAYFTNGVEVAFIIFDGRDADKNGWFNDDRILYSYWTDIIGYTKVGSSIDGDNTRRFSVHKEHGGCPNDKAWMNILDSSDSSQPCSWDQNVRPRPYFLYSSKKTWALCEANGAWNQAEFPAAETMAIFVKGWRMVMKVAHTMSISPASSVYDLWTGTYTLNEFDTDALTIATGTKTYKSSVVDNWSSYQISAIRVSFYSKGKETAYAVFDAHGVTDKNSWFDCSRLLYTAYDDLNRLKAVSYCGIPGDGSLERRFFIQNNYGGCSNDAGWFLVVEKDTCAWEQRTTRPYFLYSGLTGRDLQDNMVIADLFLISVVMDNCFPNPCQNGGACYDEGMDYTCTCTGDWLGQRCTDKNGVWGSWGSYGTCSKTCGTGTKTRTRTCDNPAPIGNGAACPGSSSEDADCNTQPCPIDGMWADWGSWGTCSTTCGGGNQNRTRNCTNPEPQYGGADCVGNAQDSPQTCNTNPCPIDGEWATWGSWGDCSVTCGGGSQWRNRTCTNPAPQYGGSDCVGNITDSPQDCNTQVCIIDGSWGNWGQWGTCTVTCGGGRWSRSRTCDNPAPANGGLDCPGDMSDFSDCNTDVCPTVAAGQYQQSCPSGYFTCMNGTISCIQEQYKCDCSSDCQDGSDEQEVYAGCSSSHIVNCMAQGSGTKVLASLFLMIVSAIIACLL